MRKATSHAPRIVDGAGSVGAAPAEEGKKPATRIASDSPARIFIPCHLFSIIIVLIRRINGGTVTVASFPLRDPPLDASSPWMRESWKGVLER
jgi:hypothetical protein